MNGKSAADSPPAAWFDTSALVKRYVRERGSVEVRRLLGSRAVVSSAILHVEALAAVQRRLREGKLTRRSARRVSRGIDADAELWWLVPVSSEVLARARTLVSEHPARTLDAIHVASCAILAEEGLTLSFVTADRRQSQVARAIGLEVIEIPETPPLTRRLRGALRGARLDEGDYRRDLEKKHR